ncbi:class I SAM-dependent methyltransferase [Alkalicoccus chagannorensis]|uniref:class I SAM-dependent methyltransferase n=1 Tax=Alkalicoccus chagannorensis TaxID=427072 RepID=UPI00041408A1|nr:class I SAM-dependent methyltransferase [Alkalicoccus chagannorensis]
MRKIDASVFDEKTAFFDQMACSSWFAGMQDEMVSSVGNSCLLDIGCGTGRMLGRWHEQYASATGIDFSERMIAAAAALHPECRRLSFVRGRAEALPFESGSFDTVTAVCVFFLLPDPQPAFREAARVLKPGGKLLTLNPGPDFTAARAAAAAEALPEQEKPMMKQWGDIAERRHRFTEEDLLDRLQREGFSDITFRRTANAFGMITSAVRTGAR